MQNTNESDRGTLDPLNHPNREEWVAYLYGELPRPARSALHDHLRDCAACRQNVAAWRQTMQKLDAWELPRRRRIATLAEPVLKWGLAALFMLGLGFGIGRFSAPSIQTKTLRAEIESSLRNSWGTELRNTIRRELADEVLTRLAAAQQQFGNEMNAMADRTLATANQQAQQLLAVYDDKRQDEDQTVLSRLKNFDARLTGLVGEFSNLRRDTETVALLTADSFRVTQQQMSRLASYTTTESPFSNEPETKRNH